VVHNSLISSRNGKDIVGKFLKARVGGEKGKLNRSGGNDGTGARGSKEARRQMLPWGKIFSGGEEDHGAGLARGGIGSKILSVLKEDRKH